MCTNANGVPVASMAGRAFATSASASRQNVQPKLRRKTTSVGRSAVTAVRGDEAGRTVDMM
jgi:hypothetical protein